MGNQIDRSRTQELFSVMILKLNDIIKLLKTQNELINKLTKINKK